MHERARRRGQVERVDDAIAVVRALVTMPWVSEVWIAGHSEGADVAMSVARIAPDLVRVVGLFAGAGPSQFFDDVHAARQAHEPAEEIFRTLDAFTSGHAPEQVAGHPAARSQSYAVESSVLDDLYTTPRSIPIYVAHGTADNHVPIASADIFVVEALRQRERSVRYVTVADGGHGFEDEATDAQAVVLADFIRWARPSRALVLCHHAAQAPRSCREILRRS